MKFSTVTASALHVLKHKRTQSVSDNITIFDFDEIKKAASCISNDGSGFLGDNNTLPTAELIGKYRAYGLDEVFGDDGIMYYSEDTSVIKARNIMFSELFENDILFCALQDFSNAMKSITAVTDSRTQNRLEQLSNICAAKQYIRAFHELYKNGKSALISSSSEMLLKLYSLVCREISGKGFFELYKKYSSIPDEYTDVKSITLTVDLDGGFRPDGIGIVSLNKQNYKDIEPTGQCSVCRRDIKAVRPDAMTDAVLTAADKHIAGILDMVGINVKRSISSRMDDIKQLLDEIHFIVNAACVMRELKDRMSVNFVYDYDDSWNIDLCNIAEEYRKLKLGYDADAVSGVTADDFLYESALMCIGLGIGVWTKAVRQ